MTPPELRILKYEIGVWQVISESMVNVTEVDWGGIWCARTRGDGRALYRYFQKSHGPARILVCAMREPLFAKRDLVKCRGVYPIEELDLLR